ncbi:phage minor head protein [Nocardia panacis]|uniref:phage minor head protein n=1 Tax=Nocardia panacis TaxID=2340916 RepID=UPI00193AD230|nr:phage minor head protein [Nocardia panacis]
MHRLLGEDRERLSESEWTSRTLAEVRTGLLGIPARTAEKVRAAVRAAGESVDAARIAAARALRAAWQSEAAEIGRTQAVSIYNATRVARAQLEEQNTGRALDKVWIALHDTRTRHTHRQADRQRVSLAADFIVGGVSLRYPGDPSGPPGEVIGCRCVVTILESALENQTPARVASATDSGGTMSAKTFEALLMPAGIGGRSGMSMLAQDAQLLDTKLPFALKWQRQDDPGHDGSLTVGAIETLELREGGLWATGTMLDTPDAAEAIQQIEAGVTAPSAELVVRSETLTDTTGSPVTPETAEQVWMDGAVVMRMDAVEIVGASLVSVPEFRETSITLGDITTAPSLALVAAAVVEEDTYPAEFFANPLLEQPTPIHVDESGRVVGHLATWGTCHTGVRERCVTPYRSHSNYAEFHQSSVKLDDGERLRVGRLTVGGGHGPAGQGMRAAVEHYDNVGTCWALARAGEDEHGIWVSGAINPAADPAMVKQALGTPHSGHWERVAGHPELIAACAVNAPGFPIVSRKRDRDGDLAMVASFAPRPARPAVDTSILDDVAARAVAAYAQQQADQARSLAARNLMAASVPRRRVLADAIRESHRRREQKVS